MDAKPERRNTWAYKYYYYTNLQYYTTTIYDNVPLYLTVLILCSQTISVNSQWVVLLIRVPFLGSPK